MLVGAEQQGISSTVLLDVQELCIFCLFAQLADTLVQ